MERKIEIKKKKVTCTNAICEKIVVPSSCRVFCTRNYFQQMVKWLQTLLLSGTKIYIGVGKVIGELKTESKIGDVQFLDQYSLLFRSALATDIVRELHTHEIVNIDFWTLLEIEASEDNIPEWFSALLNKKEAIEIDYDSKTKTTTTSQEIHYHLYPQDEEEEEDEDKINVFLKNHIQNSLHSVLKGISAALTTKSVIIIDFFVQDSISDIIRQLAVLIKRLYPTYEVHLWLRYKKKGTKTTKIEEELIQLPKKSR